MEQGFYDEHNSAKGSRKRGIGGYVATAIIFFIIGALVSSFILPQMYPLMSNESLLPLPKPTAQQPAVVPNATQTQPKPTAEVLEPTAAPAPTPQPTQRLMPELDGLVPTIPDVNNPIPDIVEQVSGGVVGILNYAYSEEFSRDYTSSSGSGFVISSEGYIITNSHVVDGATKVGVLFADGEEMQAEVLGMDKSTDIAVLKVDKAGLMALTLGDSDSVRVGEFTIAIGDPTGRELAGTTTFGIISATKRSVNIDGRTNDYIQTDAAVNPGNSGGPLISMSGKVIGVTSAKTVTASYDESGNPIYAEGLGFALPINEAVRIASDLITNGVIRRPGIGISVITIDELSSLQYGIPQGTLVYSVTKDGPGHKSGLVIGDVIIECNGMPTMDKESFTGLVKDLSVGDELKLKVLRGDETLEIVLVLGDLNEMGNELVGGYAELKPQE